MPFPTIDPNVNEYQNPITQASYARGPNNVWTQIDQFNKVDIAVLEAALDSRYVNVSGDTMTGALTLNRKSDGDEGFKLLGRQPGQSGNTDPILTLSFNSGTTGDEVNYTGYIGNANNLVNKKYVDDAVAGVSAPSGFLPLDGGSMTGDITFNGDDNRIVAGTVSNLSGRCSLLLTTAGGDPVGISSSSETGAILSLYKYDSSEDDNRGEVFRFQANGYSRFGGKIRIKPTLLNDGDTAIEVQDDTTDPTFTVKKSGRVEIKATDTSDSYIFAVYPSGLSADSSKAGFRVTADGKVKAGYNSSEFFEATVGNDVVTKGWLEGTALSSYLPLAGGTVTGKLTAAGSLEMTDHVHIKDMKDIRFYAADNSTRIARYYNLNDTLHRLLVENGATYVIRGADASQNLIECTASGTTKIKKLVTPSASDDAATKAYVDGKTAGSSGVIIGTSPNPPSGNDRGTLLLTTDNKFYIYI